jgi:hypothetical protein
MLAIAAIGFSVASAAPAAGAFGGVFSAAVFD